MMYLSDCIETLERRRLAQSEWLDWAYNNEKLKMCDSHIRYRKSTLNNSIYEITMEDTKMRMPKIKEHTYIKNTGVTILEWSDGTKTVARAENPDTADEYVGFMMAIAKKAMGNDNTASNLADYWLVKKPERDARATWEKEAREAEQKRIEKKHKEKREKYLIKKEALRLKREYEAKKLAAEKYGIPMD